LLEVLQVVERDRGLLPWELLLEVLCIVVKLPDHVINLCDVVLKSVLLIFDLLIPDLSEMSLDVSLGLVGISKHL